MQQTVSIHCTACYSNLRRVDRPLYSLLLGQQQRDRIRHWAHVFAHSKEGHPREENSLATRVRSRRAALLDGFWFLARALFTGDGASQCAARVGR